MKEITLTLTAEEANALEGILAIATEETANPVVEELADNMYDKLTKAMEN